MYRTKRKARKERERGKDGEIERDGAEERKEGAGGCRGIGGQEEERHIYEREIEGVKDKENSDGKLICEGPSLT